MAGHRHTLSPLATFSLAIAALALILGCRASDAISQAVSRRAGAAASRPTATRVAKPTLTPTESLVEIGGEMGASTPTEAPTDTPAPADTTEATQVKPAAPAPTRTRALLPTRTPGPSLTPSPAPSPVPTRCSYTYCITVSKCVSGENTRAIGTVYENGVPKNGVVVRVSYAYGGAGVTEDFISGHSPINRDLLDPAHPGYYQLGIMEGGAQDGNWWVFLMDDKKQTVISDGHFFKTSNVVTGDTCNIGVTDFNK